MGNKKIQFDENILFGSFSDLPEKEGKWKVIIADDEDEVHTITKMVLKNIIFEGREIEFLSAYSGAQTIKLITENKDVAVLLLDVVMEKDDTGLEVVKYIREELGNKKVRIILRTGQSGQSPEKNVIDNYDINDYKQKTELTAQKLYTALTLGLRGYKDLIRIEKSQERVNVIKLFLHNILESMTSGLIVLNEEFTITLCNGIAKELINHETDKVLGKNIFDISDFFSKYKKTLNASLSENVINTIYHIPHLENNMYDIMIYPFDFYNFCGLVIRIDDVSEIVARDEQIRRIQKLDTIGTLAAGLAHDFNNILGGISGALSLIKIESNQLREDSLIKSGVETINESITRASFIVKKLLSITRKENVEFIPLDLNTTVRNIMSICEKSLDKSIITTINYYEKEAMIYGDVSQIEQIILNLSINAGHAMTIMRETAESWGGYLDISIYLAENNDELYTNHHTKIDNKFYVIEIKDTGVGIDETLKDKIFDPFFTTKKKDAGTGLGLSMVYNIITQHNGVIILNSLKGHGASFKLYFPKLDTAEKKLQKDLFLKQGKGRIIVADDEPAILQIVKKTLEICGYTIIVCANGKEVIEEYKNNTIDLVVADIDMPCVSGICAFRELKKIDPGVKLVFISGHEIDHEISECIDDGALGLISKPFNMQKFSVMIFNIINDIKPYDA